MKKILKKKKIIILGIIILIIMFITIKFGENKPTNNTNLTKEYTAQLGDISSTISGKASVEPNDQYTITSLVSGDVLNTYFEEGDIIEKDAIMYEIDSSDVSKSIESADLSLQKANISLKKTNDSISDLNIYSSYSGVVTDIKVKVGDTIQNGQVLANVHDDSTLKIKVPFNESDVSNFYNGQSATLTMSDTGFEVYGWISSISNSSYSLSGYMRVKDVEITINNPGSIKEGQKAMAMIGDYACNSAGTFENSVNESIKATSSGKILSLKLKENTKVSKGDLIITLDGKDLLTQKETNELSLREAELSKEKTMDKLDDYTIKAPISGTVIDKEVKTGDKLDTTKGATTLAIIYDLSSLKFDMDVDELDISKVKVGQEVSITADAIKDKTYTGVVEKININGTANNGVTTYPVTVRINDFEDLLPGMNVDAEIIVEKAENILIIPSECLNRGNTVYVKGEKTETDDNAPEGYKTVKVETGLADSSYIEITKGLKEGDIVRGTELSNENKIMQQMMEMHNQAESGNIPMGNMGGGMPSGGGPGGGNPMGR